MALIADDVLLLLLDDTKGTVSPWGNTDAVLGGAVLAELAILGLATVDEKKRKAVAANTATTKRQLKKGAREIAEGQWAAKAVKDAVDAAAAASGGG